MFSLTFRLLLLLLLRSPPPSPSSFSLPPPASVPPLDSFLAALHVRTAGDFDYVNDCDLLTMRDFDCDYPGPVSVSWRLGLGVPRVPPPEPALPYAPGAWEVPGQR